MVWVLVCVLVALLGLGYLGLQAREVVRKGGRLVAEIEDAARRLEAAATPEPGDPPDPTRTGEVTSEPAHPAGWHRPGGRGAASPRRRTLPVPDQRR